MTPEDVSNLTQNQVFVFLDRIAADDDDGWVPYSPQKAQEMLEQKERE